MTTTTIEQAREKLLDEADKFFRPGGHNIYFLISIARFIIEHGKAVTEDAKRFPVKTYLGIPIINDSLDKALLVNESINGKPNYALVDIKGFLDNGDLRRVVIGTAVDFSTVIRNSAVFALRDAGFSLVVVTPNSDGEEGIEPMVYLDIGEVFIEL